MKKPRSLKSTFIFLFKDKSILVEKIIGTDPTPNFYRVYNTKGKQNKESKFKLVGYCYEEI